MLGSRWETILTNVSRQLELRCNESRRLPSTPGLLQEKQMSWVDSLPWNSIYKASNENKIDPLVLAALIQTESGGDEYSTRYEPAFKYILNARIWSEKLLITTETETAHQMTSWGLTHIMGAVARELGYIGQLPHLCDVDLNLLFCCRKLKLIMQRHDVNPTDPSDIYAAYNHGSVSKTDGGMYVNEANVDRFSEHLRAIKAAKSN